MKLMDNVEKATIKRGDTINIKLTDYGKNKFFKKCEVIDVRTIGKKNKKTEICFFHEEYGLMTKNLENAVIDCGRISFKDLEVGKVYISQTTNLYYKLIKDGCLLYCNSIGLNTWLKSDAMYNNLFEMEFIEVEEP